MNTAFQYVLCNNPYVFNIKVSPCRATVFVTIFLLFSKEISSEYFPNQILCIFILYCSDFSLSDVNFFSRIKFQVFCNSPFCFFIFHEISLASYKTFRTYTNIVISFFFAHHKVSFVVMDAFLCKKRTYSYEHEFGNTFDTIILLVVLFAFRIIFQ